VWGGVLETTKGYVFRKESRHRSEKSANSLDKSQKQIGNGCVGGTDLKSGGSRVVGKRETSL
jgi:hypothetical protein